jgi:hypothetical protein
MDKFIALVIGIVIGVFGVLAFQNPRKVGQAAYSGISEVQTRVEGMRRDQCVRDFLDRTQCFQKKPGRECDALIVRECGTPQ